MARADEIAAGIGSGRVTNPDQSEVLRQRLWDYQILPGAGIQQLSFFSLPQGQGVTSALGAAVGSGKTIFDTNMQMPNTLPSGKAYKVDSIEVYFWPGLSAAANTYTAFNPSNFAAAAAASVGAAANDVYTFYSSGILEFGVLDKLYVQEAPLGCFPPQTGVSLDAALTSNSATVGETALFVPRAAGRPYIMTVDLSLLPAQNFYINLRWPAAVALPSGFNARVGVVLDGHLMRASQ